MKLAIGSDHAGFAYKEAIKTMLVADGHTVRDFGTTSEAPVDYPDFIRPVAEAVARGEFERGIVLGGARHGAAVVAHRLCGVPGGLCSGGKGGRGGPAPKDPQKPAPGPGPSARDQGAGCGRRLV